MNLLQKQLRTADKSFATFCKRAESKVVRWEWCSGRRYRLEPFYFERTSEFKSLRVGRNTSQAVRRGEILPQRPAKAKGAFQYGFDSQDRVVVAREYVKNQGFVFFEEFFFHSGKGGNQQIQGMLYNANPIKNILSVSLAIFQAGRIASYTVLGEMETTETYLYQGDQLVRIEQALRKPGSSHVLCKTVLDLKYDKQGKLDTITEKASREPAEIIYQATASH
jgi:hypothetical protein